MSQIPTMNKPQLAFFLSPEGECPYLPGFVERKLFTRQVGDAAADRALSSLLTVAGFRRSHDIMYRPACAECQACVPVRLDTRSFVLSRSHRRIERRNRDLVVEFLPAEATPELFYLFQRYVWARHGQGDMAQMDWVSFLRMIRLGHVGTFLVVVREAKSRAVRGCMIVDEVEDGLSALYSFFDPDDARRSLGTFLLLALIRENQRRAQAYVYLGYWIGACAKMSYKARFRPLEKLVGEAWVPFDESSL